MKRGALIVVEGVDRTGKSTQSKTLVESLKKRNIYAEYRNFPSRETEIGQMINKYLTSNIDLSDEAVHLLFSANRWEKAHNILKTLETGTTIILDRYCYSGVAFSAAKGLELKWCKSPDVGLPAPDKVFFLTMPLQSIAERKGFGQERYEVVEFQKKVFNVFSQLKEENWDVLDANRSIEEIQNELVNKTLKVIENAEDKPVGKMWIDEPVMVKESI